MLQLDFGLSSVCGTLVRGSVFPALLASNLVGGAASGEIVGLIVVSTAKSVKKLVP